MPGSESPGARRALAGAAAMLALLAWLVPLGSRDLDGTDEGRYSEIAREMSAGGSWLTPHLDGLKYFEKPPLQYWATAAVFKVAGASTFTARLCTALAGLLTALLVWRTARRLWGPAAGDHAGLAAAGMALLLLGSQVVTLDMLLTLWLTAALCAYLVAIDPRTAPETRRPWMAAVWLALALAVLTKGLIGAVIPGAVLVLYSVLQRDAGPLLKLEWAVGVPLFLVVAAPWFVLVSAANPEFARFFFIHEHFERFLTTTHNREGPLWYYVPLLLGGALPWTTLLPQALRSAWNTRQAGGGPRILVIWCVFVLVFFSVSQSKLPFYLLPLAPALALLVGRHLGEAAPQALRPHAVFVAALGLLVAVAGPLAIARRGSTATPAELHAAFANWVMLAGLAGALFAAAGAWLASRGNATGACAALALASLLAVQGLVAGYQSYSPAVSARGLAREIAPHLAPETEVYTLRKYDQTLPFYLGRTVTVVDYRGELAFGEKLDARRWVADLATFKDRWRVSPGAVAVAPPELATQLSDEGLPMRVIARTPRRVAFMHPEAPNG